MCRFAVNDCMIMVLFAGELLHPEHLIPPVEALRGSQIALIRIEQPSARCFPLEMVV